MRQKRNGMSDKFSLLLLWLICVYFFYLGTTIPDDYSHLLKYIKDLVSTFASFCTIFALFLAYKTYKSWSYQITHPRQFERDLEVVKELNSIHRTCEAFMSVHGFVLPQLVKDMKIDETRKQEWKSFTSFVDKEINNDLKLQFTQNVIHKSYSEFDDFEDAPSVLKDYYTSLCTFINFTNLVRRAGYQSHQIDCDLPLKYHGRVLYLSDLGIGGLLHEELHHNFKKAKLVYKNRWPIQL